MLAEIARITRLVDDLLLLAKTEQTEFLRPDSIDVPSLVSELWDGVSLPADRRYELGPIPRGTLRADPDRLAQALRNLIGNAIDEHANEGIPMQERERVFDRFHRTDPARDRTSGGAGLGLGLVRAIVEARGGSVSRSQSNEGGSRVVVELGGFRASSRPPRAGRPRVGLPAGAVAGGETP